MKKLKKLLAPVLLVIAALLYYLFGYQHADPEADPTGRPTGPAEPVPVSAPAGLAELMEIPALTSGGLIVQHESYVSSYNT